MEEFRKSGAAGSVVGLDPRPGSLRSSENRPTGIDSNKTANPDSVNEGALMAQCSTLGARTGEATPASIVFTQVHDREQLSRKLRISLADSCNLRCFFCHNEGQGALGQIGISALDISSYRLITSAAVRAGVREIKLTGGEPLLYRDAESNIIDLVSALNSLRATQQFGLSITTNGILLSRYGEQLKAAGLDRITVSLHTLNTDRFKSLISSGNRANSVSKVIDAIRLAVQLELAPVKVNMVLFGRGADSNVSEIRAVVEKCQELGVTQLRLYTLLRHDLMTNHDSWYRFWDKELLEAVGTALYGSGGSSDAFVDAAFQFITMWKHRLYPKPTLVAIAEGLEVSIEAMESGRFDDVDLPDEGAYALRLSASGKLRGTVAEKSSEIDLNAPLKADDASVALENTFINARNTLLP